MNFYLLEIDIYIYELNVILYNLYNKIQYNDFFIVQYF